MIDFSLLYPPFATLLRQSGAVPTAGTLSRGDAMTAFLHGGGPRPEANPQCLGIAVVCEYSPNVPPVGMGLLAGPPTHDLRRLVQLDLDGRTTIPALRVLFDRRGRHDMRAGLEDVFEDLNRRAPWP